MVLLFAEEGFWYFFFVVGVAHSRTHIHVQQSCFFLSLLQQCLFATCKGFLFRLGVTSYLFHSVLPGIPLAVLYSASAHCFALSLSLLVTSQCRHFFRTDQQAECLSSLPLLWRPFFTAAVRMSFAEFVHPANVEDRLPFHFRCHFSFFFFKALEAVFAA